MESEVKGQNRILNYFIRGSITVWLTSGFLFGFSCFAYLLLLNDQQFYLFG